MKVKFGFVPVGGAKSFEAALNEVCLAEKLGFDSAWVQERHLQQNHTWSAPLVAAMGFVTHTSRLLIGTDILVYPFYHPMRLAEEVALLDIISKGDLFLAPQLATDRMNLRFTEYNWKDAVLVLKKV